MTATTIAEIQRFAQSVSAAGGAIPDPVHNLLRSYAVLNTPTATEAPKNAIMDAMLDGSLTAAKLDKLLPAATAAHDNNQHRALLARDSEHTIVGAIHRAFQAGGADSVLSSMRDKFTIHAEAIAHARSMFNAESSAEHTLNSGTPGVVEAWQALPDHIRVVAAIGAVAAQFGPSALAWFPQLREFPQGDTFRISDTAVMCGDGGLAGDSAPFLVPSGQHKDSPWFQIPLKLHSIASAAERYRQWCEAEHDRVHADRPRGGRIDEATGRVIQDPIPPNPFREEISI